MPNPIDVAAALILVRNPDFCVGGHRLFVLLQQRAPTREFGLHWEMPGGKVEADEEPHETVRRELLEELTIDVGPVFPRPLVMCGFNPPRVQAPCNVAFYVVQISMQAVKEIALTDAIGYGLFGIHDIASLTCVPSCEVVCSHVSAMGGIDAAHAWIKP